MVSERLRFPDREERRGKVSKGLLSSDGEAWRADPWESVKWVFPWLGRNQRPNRIGQGLCALCGPSVVLCGPCNSLGWAAASEYLHSAGCICAGQWCFSC